jgi:hypothetical protein
VCQQGNHSARLCLGPSGLAVIAQQQPLEWIELYDTSRQPQLAESPKVLRFTKHMAAWSLRIPGRPFCHWNVNCQPQMVLYTDPKAH